KKEIGIYQFQLDEIEQEINNLQKEIEKICKDTYNNVIELSLRESYFLSLKRKVEEKNVEKEKILEKIDKIKENLSILLGEKKAVEKYEKKVKKKDEKEKEKKLIELYDSVFNNRRFNS
ncbi:hypothetical protein HG1285_04161, partial [Hydrogenivirga sp. 128-5-R1-1]